MGNVQSPKKVNYEDMQIIIKKNRTNMLLINTLELNEQLDPILTLLNSEE